MHQLLQVLRLSALVTNPSVRYLTPKLRYSSPDDLKLDEQLVPGLIPDLHQTPVAEIDLTKNLQHCFSYQMRLSVPGSRASHFRPTTFTKQQQPKHLLESTRCNPRHGPQMLVTSSTTGQLIDQAFQGSQNCRAYESRPLRTSTPVDSSMMIFSDTNCANFRLQVHTSLEEQYENGGKRRGI